MEFLSKILTNAGLITNYADFDTASTQTGAVGRMVWNNTDGTIDLGLKGGNVTLQVGQEIVARVVNKSGANLLEANYQVVKVSDAQGQRLAVDLAQADNDANSADTLGIVTETINNNQEGFITILGNVNEINTTGSLQGETWVDGDILYLSATTAGEITNIKPAAPQHLVVVGYVIYAHAIHGKIYTKIQNGYELNELHDVLITTPLNNQVLGYDSATSLWKNASIATWLGYTPYNAASVSGTANRITKFGAGNTLGNGSMSDDGSYIYNNAIPFYLTGVNPIRLIGGVGQPEYMTLDQTANSGGKKWRLGHTGAVTGFSSFDFYNETDGTVPLTLAADGSIITNSAANTGEKFIVGGSARVNGTQLVTGAATFSSTITVGGVTKMKEGSGFNLDTALEAGMYYYAGVIYAYNNVGAWRFSTDTNSNAFELAAAGAATFSSSATALSFIKTGSSDSYFLLGGGGTVAISSYLTTSAAATGYIKNQIVSAQTSSNFWISGNGRVNGKVYIGSHGAYFEEFYDGTIYKIKIVDSAGNDIIL